MSALHTKGPWKIDSGEALKVRNVSGSIAMIMQTHLRGRRSSDETRANARLIAAAPDMLEALQNLMRHMPDYADTVWIDAQAAIARATGAKP